MTASLRQRLVAARDIGLAIAAPFRLTHEAGDRHPANRYLRDPRVRVAAFLIVLGVLAACVDAGAIRFVAWTDFVFSHDRVPWLLTAYGVGVTAVHIAPDTWRLALLLALSLATACAFSVAFTALSIAYFAVLYAVLFARVHRLWKLSFLVATYVAWAVACNVAWHADWLADNATVLLFGYVFAMSYTFRVVYFYHDRKQRDFARVPFASYLLYMMIAPYFVILPYMLSIPRFDQFQRSLQQRDAAVESSGVRYLAAGLALALAATAVFHTVDIRGAFDHAVQERAWGTIAALALLRYPGWTVLAIVGTAYVLTGLLRGLGIDVEPPFDRPLRSTSVLDWWRRWNTHFRRFLVDLYFYPVVFRWRRKAPYLGIVLGCAAVFLFGSTVFHWLTRRYFTLGSHREIYWTIIAENSVFFAFVAVALCLEKRRLGRRVAPVPPPRLDDPATPIGQWLRHRLGMAGRVLTTYVLVFVGVVGIGRTAGYFANERPMEQIEARMNDARAADTATAGRWAAADVDQLRALVARRPRDARRRVALALAIALTGTDDRAARRELAISRAVSWPRSTRMWIRQLEVEEILDDTQ